MPQPDERPTPGPVPQPSGAPGPQEIAAWQAELRRIRELDGQAAPAAARELLDTLERRLDQQ